MKDNMIITVAIDEPVMIEGHIFRDIDDIRDAVGPRASIEYMSRNDLQIYFDTPRKSIEGMHVLELYCSYPCFDSSDYAYESRFYRNFFFSKEKFTRAKIEQIAKLPQRANHRMVNEDLPEWARPAVYYVGEGRYMEVAY